MFMRGTMEKEPVTVMHVVPVDLEWKVDAIVEADSKAFAAELQRVLNENTANGFIVSSMMQRPDNALVVIQQRRLLRHDPEAQSPTGQEAAN